MNGIVRFYGFKPHDDLRVYVNNFIKQIIDSEIPATSVQLGLKKNESKFEGKCILQGPNGEIPLTVFGDSPRDVIDEVDRLIRQKLSSQSDNSKFFDLPIYGLGQD